MTVTVSVILPTYNRSVSLRAASESVLSQSFRDLELIIVDDASSEDILTVVSELNDERVRYVRHVVNGGVSRARNTGLANAGGAFIAFQDSDDLWLPGKLSRQMAFFETLPEDVGVVIGSKILYGRDASRRYGPGRVTCAPPPDQPLKLDEDQVRRFLGGNRISLQNAVFRRDCFPDDIWFDPCAKANADWEFTSRLAQHTRIFEDIEPVVLAFVSGDSISTNIRKKGLGLVRILKKNKAALENYPDVHARNLIKFAGVMQRLGKKRTARRMIWAALRVHAGASLFELATKASNQLRLIRITRRDV
jgi:glycosyltransferase involved in cell wall biosynthesis